MRKNPRSDRRRHRSAAAQFASKSMRLRHFCGYMLGWFLTGAAFCMVFAGIWSVDERRAYGIRAMILGAAALVVLAVTAVCQDKWIEKNL